jgi:TolB-like protein/Tfp pilus assembly protein PilF
MTLAAGSRIGPYEVTALLGAGGMGEVYRAKDPRLERQVAIKILPPAVAADPDRLQRFQQEARAIAAVNHPNICQIYDVGPDYLVLECVEGTPPRGPMPPEAAVRLILQVTSALEAAHARGILHRDLKPANILVTSDGTAKLLDFGLAKLIDPDADLTRTQFGAVVGTVSYMSPEQAEGRPVDVRSDIFSLGAVLYELLSGRRAFDGDSIVQTISAVLRADPPAINAPPALAGIVTRCLARVSRDRFQTMAELRRALEDSARPAASAQPSIAVLPFTDMSPAKDHEWFSDGLAEEIINALTHVPGLKVIARTSAFAFKGKHEDVRRIAAVLGVTTILEGSVRKAGDRLRVTAQLITAEDGSHLWSERYDRDMTDVFAIQDEIARAIAAALELKLSGDMHNRARVPALPAYEAFLKARYQMPKFTPQAFARARQLLEEAIASDPAFALAHSELGWCFFSHATENLLPAGEAAALMRSEAQRALGVDSRLPDAHAVLALAAAVDYDWAEAERHFRAATALDPVPPMVRYFYALFYLAPLGRTREAERELERALRDDPLNLLTRTTLAFLHVGTGEITAGQRELREVLEFDENFWIAHVWLCGACMAAARWDDALAWAEKAYSVVPQHRAIAGLLSGLLERSGETARSKLLLEKLERGEAYGAPAGLFYYHAALGEWELAASWLEKAIEQHDTRAPWILPRMFGDRLTSSEYWPALARKMNLA